MILIPKKNLLFHGMLPNWDGLAKHELTEEYKDIRKIIWYIILSSSPRNQSQKSKTTLNSKFDFKACSYTVKVLIKTQSWIKVCLLNCLHLHISTQFWTQWILTNPIFGKWPILRGFCDQCYVQHSVFFLLKCAKCFMIEMSWLWNIPFGYQQKWSNIEIIC